MDEDIEVAVTPVSDLQSATCEKCGTVYYVGDDYRCPHGPLHSSPAQGFDPVVIHESADGKRVRFPGSTDSAVPAGFVKKELRTVVEVRRFQARVTRDERSKIEQAVEHEHMFIEHLEATHRPDLRMAMQHMTPQQRAFAQHAIDVNNARRPKTFDPGFYLDVFENNRSNRDDYVDERTGWKRGRS